MGKAAFFRSSLNRILDFLYPPRCLGCGESVDRQGGVCATCWRNLRFITSPMCVRCGLPFDFDSGPDNSCGNCMAHEPPFDKARTALAYDAGSRSFLIGLKHNKIQAIPTLTDWMLREGGALLHDADYLCAVPLHRWRLLKRSYNQAILLAQSLSKTTGKPTIPDLLLRVRDTISQGGLSRSGRQRNVRGAFRIHPKWEGLVKGKKIVLVDDVFTTGATLGECCRILRKAGADRIDVLTVARVI